MPPVSSPPASRGLRPDEAVVLVLLASVWGASFLFIKVALEDVGPLTVVASRLVLAAVAIGAVLLRRRGWDGIRRMVAPVRPLDALVLAVTAAAVPFALIAWAETRISSSLAGILNAAVPLLTALIALRVDPLNRLRGWRNVGLVVGFAGVAIVAGSDVDGSRTGILAMLGAVTLYAIGSHWARARFADVEPIAIALVQTVTSAVLVLPLALAFDRPDRVPSFDTLAALFALGIGGTAVGFLLYYRLLSSAGPQHAVAVTYLAPIAAVFYGSVLLDERITSAAIAGMVVILVGQLLTALPGRRRPEPA